MPPPEEVISLDWTQVALLLILIVAILVMSVSLRMGLVRQLSIATIRSIVQLVAVGLIIGWVFSHRTWYWVMVLLLAMTLVAGVTGARRTPIKLWWLSGLFSLVLGAATAVTLAYISVIVIGVREWDPRYLIPLGGIMLGNAMTAATLATERLLADLDRDHSDVELLLALGASPAQAVHSLMRSAVRAGMMPTLNTMMIVGIVQLPGMMTGQMLGGTAPLQAALYQFLILVAIAFCAAVSALVMVRALSRRFFSSAWQLDRAALGRVRLT